MRLNAAGIARDALRLAIVTLPNGQFHVVLVAQSERGSLVLDNRTDAVKLWRETPYRWLVAEYRETPASSMAWHIIEEGTQQ